MSIFIFCLLLATEAERLINLVIIHPSVHSHIQAFIEHLLSPRPLVCTQGSCPASLKSSAPPHKVTGSRCKEKVVSEMGKAGSWVLSERLDPTMPEASTTPGKEFPLLWKLKVLCVCFL